MPQFTYRTTKEVIDGHSRYKFTLCVGGVDVAWADLTAMADGVYWMDNYRVSTSRMGYPYALTYCMLRMVALKRGREAQIRSAHEGMLGVGSEGFQEIDGSQDWVKGTEDLKVASFRTTDIPATILAQQIKMEELAYNLHEQVSEQPSSCCYITTAVCKALELGDNCEELTALRTFRDEVLLKTERGLKDVERYYAIAPDIVVSIDQRPDSFDIYQDLYRRYIGPSVAALSLGQSERSYTLFREMVEETSEKYL